MVLFALAALGLGIGYGLWGPDWGLVDWLAANSDYILYLLMFSVGISVGGPQTRTWAPSFVNPQILDLATRL